MEKVFSIITASYNAEKTIEKTIKSIVTQNLDLFEYIIVDGLSNDNTVDIIKKYKESYPLNIRFISELDKGIYDAMNKGIDMAKGEYLLFIGAGDRLYPHVLENIKDCLNYKSEMIYGLMYHKDYNGLYGGYYNKSHIVLRPMPHPATFYHKSIFEKLGKYDLDYIYGSDHVFNIKCFGRDDIKKTFIDIIIDEFEAGGISSYKRDIKYMNDLGKIILDNLGRKYYDIYRYRGRQFVDYMRNTEGDNVIIFGINNVVSKEVEKKIKQNNKFLGKPCINLLSYCSYNEEEWGIEYNGHKVEPPKIELLNKADKIIIASREYMLIEKKLIDTGISLDKILIAQELLYTDEFISYVQNTQNEEVIIFGTGEAGQKVYNYIKEFSLSKNRPLTIRFFMDNNKCKWDTELLGISIVQPCVVTIGNTKLIIASIWKNEIRKQLLDMGIKEEYIIDAVC